MKEELLKLIIKKQYTKVKKLITEIATGKTDVYTAYEELKDSGSLDETIKKLKKFRDFVIEPSFAENINNEEAMFLLKKIEGVIKKYLSK